MVIKCNIRGGALDKTIKEIKPLILTKVTLQNVRCFDTIEIDLETRPHVAVLIGTNAGGKTTLLQVIAMALNAIETVPFTHTGTDLVKKGADKGKIKINAIFEEKPLEIEAEIDRNNKIHYTKGENGIAIIKQEAMVTAYGIDRGIKLENVINSSTYQHVKVHFKEIQKITNKVLTGVDPDYKITLQGYDTETLYFKMPSLPDRILPLKGLSDGYKLTLGWLFDMLVRIAERRGSLKHIEKVKGVLLIDEIDLHLHPSWQRKIIPTINQVFPGIQVITATHSPFVAQAVETHNMIVLEYDKNKKQVIVADKDQTSRMSYNAIVRQVFNIKSPFSYEIEQLLDGFYTKAEAIRKKENIDTTRDTDIKEFFELAQSIAEKGVELEGVIRREIQTLEKRTGKDFVGA